MSSRLCLLRTLLPRVMTVTEARRGLILLPIKCSCSAHAYNRGSSPSPGPIPDLPGMGGPSPSPSPICRGWGVHPHAGDGGSIPIPIPDLPGIWDHPHPRFPSGVPCPVLAAGTSTERLQVGRKLAAGAYGYPRRVHLNRELPPFAQVPPWQELADRPGITAIPDRTLAAALR